MASEAKFTVTGSWLSDRQQLPGLWREVYQYVQMKQYTRKIVENTLDLARGKG